MEILFTDKNIFVEQQTDIILNKLNTLAAEGKTKEFINYLQENIDPAFKIKTEEKFEDLDNIVFEKNLSPESLNIILKSYPDLRKAISKKEDNIICALFVHYSNTYSILEFYLEKSDEIIKERESIYNKFLKKLKVAIDNKVNVKFRGDNGLTCLHYLTFDEFVLTKIKELTSCLLGAGFTLNEHDFRSILSSNNFLYTKEIPQGIIDFCDLFSEYSLSIRSIEMLFDRNSYNENFSPINYDDNNPPSIKFLEKNNLDINDYSDQENLTLIKYFTERYNIDIANEIKSKNCEDLLELVAFEQTAQYLIEKGCTLMKNIEEYPIPVKKVLANIEKEKIQKHIKNNNNINIIQKRL